MQVDTDEKMLPRLSVAEAFVANYANQSSPVPLGKP